MILNYFFYPELKLIEAEADEKEDDVEEVDDELDRGDIISSFKLIALN